ncbi:hypothetical protein DW083_19780 [Parabacteroides sp. AF48-14]|uniref:hypothetical protein n=1 Tax=Parabacteroides sp. AF48-14 TaxID=2292052 RepID=UPI000EFDC474|nr:hypothetical protein [Parabacteroides sp. AF48-14]RHO65969.1 hypothetical protein DW083_19780 [Parabacteroides sp. AF48-14]
MTTTIKKTNQSDLLTLLAIVSCALIMAAQSISVPHYMPASKIEEGTVVVRNDSVTTVIIPDIR